jgi:hypothetical protein
MQSIPTYRVVEHWDGCRRSFSVQAWEAGRLVRIITEGVDQVSAHAVRDRLSRHLAALMGRNLQSETERAYTGGASLRGSRRGVWWR